MSASLKSNTLSPQRKLWKFHGGVHPPFHKDDSNQEPIKTAGIPAQLILPVQQHIGNAAEPLVQTGDQVFKGQIIAHANHVGLSAHIHAPTSGVVSAIEERPLPHPSGLSGECIVIDTDAKDDWGEYKLKPYPDFETTEVNELLDRIQQAGIVGLGGAAFPTAVKLAKPSIQSSPSKNQQSTIEKQAKPLKTLIINGAECEPYITCDDRLMREKSKEIVTGIRILQRMINPELCLIGIEDNKPEAIQAMQIACRDFTDIEVVSIPTIYPSGGEKQLIEILTGKEVPAGGLPLDIGILGQNVGTVYSIYKAVVEGEPLLSRIVTVTGNGVMHPQNFETLIGTPFGFLAEQAGGYTKMADHLIMGGPMMGFGLQDDHVPIVKATNCALFISTIALNDSNSENSHQVTLPCIRCGKCMEACPVDLLPQQLYWHIRAKDFEKAQDHNLKDCIECGCCSYVCPSHIPLVDYYRFAKTEIREQQTAQHKANLSRERHEFLLFRKERDKREREEKRAAHKAALQKKKAAASAKKKASGNDDNNSPTDSKADAIKAAMERAKARKQAMAAESKQSDEIKEKKTSSH